MKNMTSTFKSNSLPMPRDFVSTQFIGTKSTSIGRQNTYNFKTFKHIGRKLDIIATPTNRYSSLTIIFSSIMDSYFVLILNWNLFRNSGILTKVYTLPNPLS